MQRRAELLAWLRRMASMQHLRHGAYLGLFWPCGSEPGSASDENSLPKPHWYRRLSGGGAVGRSDMGAGE